MLVDEIILAFPLLTSVLGEKWLRQNLWYEDFLSLRLEWYDQLERNLRSLFSSVGLQPLRKCYGSMLRDQKSIWTTLYEINGVSLVGEASTSLEIHVPRGDSSGRNFDAKAIINGTELNIECKTRKDDFPFNMPKILEGPERIAIHSGSRSTLDPHDAAELGLGFDFPDRDPSFKTTPASTEVRQIMSKGLAQLPARGCNLILLGELGFSNDIDEALFGTELFYFHREAATRQYLSHWTRAPTGAFCSGPPGEPFRHLSGILWFRLLSALGSEYKLYVNPNALSPIPDDVVIALDYVIEHWTNH
jgi:hypothetical protein